MIHLSDHRLAERYAAVRATTRALADGLSPEDCQAQSMPDASPVKWHLAHTTWFFATFVLERWRPRLPAFDPSFRVLFNSYYETVGDKHPRPQRGLVTRPGLERVQEYRDYVDDAMQELLHTAADDTALAALVELGLHHEQQHQELILMDLKHLFSCNPLLPAYREAAAPRSAWPTAPQPLRWVEQPAGVHAIGHGGPDFAFDNESPRHDVLLRPWALAHRPVTEPEYLAFIEDGGYRRPELWLSMGWDIVRTRDWQAPLYWRQAQDGAWQVFTLRGERALAGDVPVCHLSYFEADAYARWAGARLPTEAEWEVAAAGLSLLQPAANTLESDALGPLPAPAGDATLSLAQMLGDVWEWTSSSYAPYPGFHPAEGAIGEYNGKFMCNQYVLRGGSFATPASHLRASYRNFFPPDARWQFGGLRLARDLG
ncbi:ergothioneine biosynthesis protein EgtB [Verticiella sediminum]|nr:ergothioneine biosynthesis protein EgtB [Verticiella sediminum]